MKDTNYANPHGLDCSYRLEAYSNVHDQAVLAKTLFSNPECVAIMGKRAHIGQMKTTIGKEV